MAIFYTNVFKFSNHIFFRGYSVGTAQDGRETVKRHKQAFKFAPTLFEVSSNPSKYKTLSGQNVTPKQFEKMSSASMALRQNKGAASNMKIYGNEKFHHQFLAEKFKGDVPYRADKINITTIDIEVESDKGFPDVDRPIQAVTAITIKNNIDNIYYVFGKGEWSLSKSEVKLGKHEHINYKRCSDEKELLLEFVKQWKSNYPDVVTGWNNRLFDMPFLIARFKEVFRDGVPTHDRFTGEQWYVSAKALELSPWYEELKKHRGNTTPDRNGKTNFNLGITRHMVPLGGVPVRYYNIYGIDDLDYMRIFKKYGYTFGTQESYKLDNIANVVLGEKKLDYTEYGNLSTLYRENHQKFIDYNIRDVQVVDKLEEKTKLLELAMEVAYRGKTVLEDCFGSVAVWDSILYNRLLEKDLVVAPSEAQTKERQIDGAHVKDPINGLHNWIMSFDLNSLYPHIIMQYNMSPETVINDNFPELSVDELISGRQVPNLDSVQCVAAGGQLFNKSKKGIIPELINTMYEERKVYKEKQLEYDKKVEADKNDEESKRQSIIFGNKQQAIKILMNSLYGAMSNEFFRYFDIRIAESITRSGQLTIRTAEKAVNEYLNKILKTERVDYVIAIDTDSLYINFGPLVEKYLGKNVSREKGLKFLDKIGKEKMEPLFENTYLDLKDRLKCSTNMMFMKREVIAEKGIWTGKKHYVLNVLDSEGVTYKDPKLKVQGIEAVRSSTPLKIRDLIRQTLKVLLEADEDRLIKFIDDARKYFYRLSPEDQAFPRGVSRLNKYWDENNIYKKSTPIQVRAALLYNEMLKQMGLDKKYDMINSGEKIKFLYLKLPNRVKENVIGFMNVLPKEFNVTGQIDLEKQFEKGYLEPIRTIVESIGWKTEKQLTLEEFF